MLGKLALSLLTTSSLGATLMYLLDPDAGDNRRKQVKRSARNAYTTAKASTAAGLDAARDTSAHLRDRLADQYADLPNKTASLRASLADRLASASNYLAPDRAGTLERDYTLDDRYYEDPNLTPHQSLAALALARRSRDLHGEARDAYSRARDMYYDALIDLELARARYRKETPSLKPAKIARPKASFNMKLPKKSSQPDYLTISLVATGCLALGAATMFILDPSAGRRRRALVRDKTYSYAKRTTDSVSRTASYATHQLTNRSRGAMAQAKTAFRTDNAPDEKLVARIRSEIGRVLSHPAAVEVSSSHGQVTLKGQCLPTEFDALLKCVYNVPGVKEVINRLETNTPTI